MNLNNKAQSRNFKSLGLIVLLVLGVTFVLAFPQFVDVLTPTGTTEDNNATIEYNITEANLKSVKFNWNGTNTTVYDNSLVGAWNFDNRSALDENDTHVFDISGNGNNGTVTNATWNSTGGKYDGAFEFNGVDNYIQIVSPSYDDTTFSNFSVFAWVKPKKYNSDESVFSFGRDNEANTTQMFEWNSGQFWRASIRNQTNFEKELTIGAIVENEWQLIGYTFNEGNMTTYYNGVVGNSEITFSDFHLKLGSRTNKIGALGWGNLYFFNGSIDEVRVWNKSLSASEVEQFYLLNLKKYDINKWSLYINQSVKTINLTSVDTNESFTYFLCATNSTSSENCTSTKTITRTQEQVTIVSNFSLNIGDIGENFYGVNNRWGNNLSWIGTGSNTTKNSLSNYTWQREKLLESGLSYYRTDMSLDTVSMSEGVFNNTINFSNYGNINSAINLVEFAKENNIKILFIANYMPVWLQNRTSGYCDSSSWKSCSATNYTKFGNTVVDFLNEVGCDTSTCEVEVWNEPDIATFWLNNLSTTDIIKSIEYNKLYNATYIAVKNAYPTMSVGGTATSGKDANTFNILFNWMGNFSNEIDFVSHHDYLGQGSFSNFDVQLKDDYSWLYGNMTSYGVNTSRILISEYNVWSTDVKVNQTNEYAIQLALAYIGTLELYPDNVSLMYYSWSSAWSYNNTGSYPEYPHKFSMVSEPLLDNEILTSFNVTKNFDTYHSVNSTVYNSSSTSTLVRTVSTKKDGFYAITVINTDTEAKNISVNLSGAYPYNNITNAETGVVYSITSDIAQIGVMDSYAIVYLTSGIAPTVTDATLWSNTTNVNITANITDDVGLKNLTFYLYNSTNALINTTIVNYVAGEISVIFSKIITLAEGIYKYFFNIWDDEEINLITSNQTLTIDTTFPLIDFTNPTPATNTNQSNDYVYVNYTTSDTNDIYSFIDFNNSLVGWWRMEGNANDDTGQNNGTVNALLTDNGRFGKGYDFDGTTLINISNSASLNISQSITLSAWVKIDTYTSYDRIIAKSPPTNAYPYTIYGLLTDTNTTGTKKVRMELASGNVQHVIRSGSGITEGVWFLLTGTHDQATNKTRLYINGVLDNSTLLNSSNVEVNISKIDTNSEPITIGRANYVGAGLDGKVDETLILNRSLSAEEVMSLYNSSKNYNNFTNLSEGTHTIKSYVVDQAGNKNETGLRSVLIDTTAPTITVNNPKPGIDEKTQPINFVTTLSENGTCEYSLDSGSRVSMSQSGLVFSDSQVLSNGNHDIIFYCNDTTDNQATSSLILFDVAITSEGGTIGGGGAGTTPTPTGEPINLSKIDIKLGKWFFGIENKVEVRTLDKDGNLIEVDEFNIEIVEDILSSKKLSRINTGKYLGEFFITNQSIEEVTLNITVSQRGKTINEIRKVDLNKLETKDKIIKKIEKLTSVIENNPEVFWSIIGIIGIIILLTASLKFLKNE